MWHETKCMILSALHKASGFLVYCLFMYINEWQEKKPLPEWQSAVATTADCHSGGGPELVQVVNANSTWTK